MPSCSATFAAAAATDASSVTSMGTNRAPSAAAASSPCSRVAGSDEHGVTEFDEAAGGLAAEPLVRSGDEGDRHAFIVRSACGSRPGTPQR